MAKYTDGILDGYQLSLSLDRYQEIMRLPIYAYNGINNPDEKPKYECNTIWKRRDRDNLATYLALAEETREVELTYHMAPKYIVDEQHNWSHDIVLNRKLFIGGGQQVTEVIEAGVALTLRDLYSAIIDPVELSVTTTVTDTSEIKVYYPNGVQEIRPSSISIAGGVATIKIPRARLLNPTYDNNRDDFPQYDNDDVFLETVDVKRVYRDESLSGVVVWRNPQVCPPNCSEITQTLCLTSRGERSKRIAHVHIAPAEFANNSWTGKFYRYGCPPDEVRISYLSGITHSPRNEILTAKLAHTMMPNEPCSCDYVKQYWRADNEEEKFYTPYGRKKGAAEVWMYDNRKRIGVGGMVQ